MEEFVKWNDVREYLPLANRVVVVKDKSNRTIRAKYVPRWSGWVLDNLDSKHRTFGKVRHWISEFELKRLSS